MGTSDYAKRAEKRATAAEKERQASIGRATNRVNAVFDAPERAAQVQAFLDAIRQNFRIDADRQKGVADRRLKFSMARSGLTGGSASVDANRLLGEEYSRGLLDAEARSQEAAGRLRSNDEASRLALIQMVRGGLDATTAAQRAGAAMSQNAQVAEGESVSKGLGDIFGGTASLYKEQQEAAERRRGERAAYGSIYGKGAFG
jgi:hypothetical protein